MGERTEEDKVCRAPLKVVLGEKEWEIRILSIRESREWRAKFSKILGSLPKWTNTTTDDPENFEKAIEAMLVEIPSMVSDLFFSYAKDLKKEEIEDIATDEELAKAFKEITAFALPLTGSLVQAMGMATSPPPASSGPGESSSSS